MNELKPRLRFSLGNKIEKIGRVSTKSVQKCTGKSWDQWIKILDEANCKNWPHREITVLLKKKFKLSPWWQQGVAIGYELHHGTRVEGRNMRGEYSTVASKTVPLNQKAAWAQLTSPAGMAIWLQPFSAFSWKPGQFFEVDGGVFGEIRTLKPGVRARFTWQEAHWPKASVVQMHLLRRPGNKCIVAIQHEKIPNAAHKAKLRGQWKQALIDFELFLNATVGDKPGKSDRAIHRKGEPGVHKGQRDRH